MSFTVLYCTVLNCTVLYCTVLYCSVLYCTLYCAVLSSWRASRDNLIFVNELLLLFFEHCNYKATNSSTGVYYCTDRTLYSTV